MSEKISRRDFLKLLASELGGVLFLAACKRSYNADPTTLPTGTETGTVEGATATEISRPTSLLEAFNSQGITVELPNPNWPTSYDQVSEILRSNNGADVLTPGKITAVVETDNQGHRVWRGWYMAEPPFPLKDRVTYDSKNGYHVDQNNNPIFDPKQIFETDWEKLPPEVKDTFPSRLVDLKINHPGIALFARRGGVTRDGLPQNSHYFAGTENVEIGAVEQLSLIPVPEICPGDISKSALTIAYRQAVLEFRDNPDARNGIISVYWFNPEIGNFVEKDGRMIAELVRQGVNLSVLERLTPGYPISPVEMAHTIGGREDKWVFKPNSGEWFFEAFPYIDGVYYIEGVGPVDANGNLLFGAEQTDSPTSQVFNFSDLDVSALSQNMMAPHEVMQADLFLRVGGYPTDQSIINHSWYTWGQGNVTLPEKAIEQARLEIVNVGSCPISDLKRIIEARVERLAEDQPDPNVTALYWNGNHFVTVQK